MLLWSLFGATAAILGRRLIDARAVRLTVDLLAAFCPAFLLLGLSRLPEPVFRLGLAAVAACAIPLFLLLARDEGAGSASGSGPLRASGAGTWPFRPGAVICIGVLFALVLSFDALARWALHATAMSAAVVFTVMLGFVLVGGTDVTVARLGTEGTLARRGSARAATEPPPPRRARDLPPRAPGATLRRASPTAPRGSELGAISFPHRFGHSLNPHDHFHVLAVDGVFNGAQLAEASAESDGRAAYVLQVGRGRIGT